MRELELHIDEDQLNAFITNDFDPSEDAYEGESDGNGDIDGNTDDDDSFSDLVSVRSTNLFVASEKDVMEGWATFENFNKESSLRWTLIDKRESSESTESMTMASSGSSSSSSSNDEFALKPSNHTALKPSNHTDQVPPLAIPRLPSPRIIKRLETAPLPPAQGEPNLSAQKFRSTFETSSRSPRPATKKRVSVKGREDARDSSVTAFNSAEDEKTGERGDLYGMPSLSDLASSIVGERTDDSLFPIAGFESEEEDSEESDESFEASHMHRQPRGSPMRLPASILRSLADESVFYESDSEAVDSWAQSDGTRSGSPSIASSGTALTCDPARLAFRALMSTHSSSMNRSPDRTKSSSAVSHEGTQRDMRLDMSQAMVRSLNRSLFQRSTPVAPTQVL
jgi:hypothetical protein